MEYLPLPNEFTKKGFHHKLIKTSLFKRFGDGEGIGSWRIYERRGVKGTNPTCDEHKKAHYEVVLIRQNESYEIHGVKIDAKEGYPSAENWGQYGFTYDDLVTAENKFDSLTLTTKERLNKIRKSSEK